MKAKTGTELTDIKELYDPQRVFQERERNAFNCALDDV